jgi:hypothetical protein
MNTELSDPSVCSFICFANENYAVKNFEISGQFDDLEFWLKDEDKKIIEENKIKSFFAEVILQTQKDQSISSQVRPGLQ